jgi:hypothetical protein
MSIQPPALDNSMRSQFRFFTGAKSIGNPGEERVIAQR